MTQHGDAPKYGEPWPRGATAPPPSRITHRPHPHPPPSACC
jgi:hypothetical protein